MEWIKLKPTGVGSDGSRKYEITGLPGGPAKGPSLSPIQTAYHDLAHERAEYDRLMREHLAGTSHTLEEFFPVIARMNAALGRLMATAQPYLR